LSVSSYVRAFTSDTAYTDDGIQTTGDTSHQMGTLCT